MVISSCDVTPYFAVGLLLPLVKAQVLFLMVYGFESCVAAMGLGVFRRMASAVRLFIITMRDSRFVLFDLISEIYWRGIPLTCRDCAFLESCRTGFWKGRKCLNGCHKAKFRKRMEYAEEHDEYFDALIDHIEKTGRP